MGADAVETFAYIYEVDAGPLKGAIGQAKDHINTFVTQTTEGLTTVRETVKSTLVELLKFGGKKVSEAFEHLGVSVEQQIFILRTAQEVGQIFFAVFDKGRKIIGSLVDLFRQCNDETESLSKSQMKFTKDQRMGAHAAFQQKNSLSGVFSVLKSIAKIGGFAVILGPLLPLIKPLMYLIEAITKTLEPAMKTISGAVEAALAPLSFYLQQLAVKFLPYISELLDPIVSILVEGVMMMIDFFEEGYLDEMMTSFRKVIPIVRNIVRLFIDKFLKPAGGKLLNILVNLFVKLVDLGAQFIEKLEPFLPAFFDNLLKIADLIMTSLGNALDTLLTELIKQLPDIIESFGKMLALIAKLLPKLMQLIPPLMQLIMLVVTRLLLPTALAILEGIIDSLISLVDKLIESGIVDELADMLDAVKEWWEANGDVFVDTVDAISDRLEIFKGYIGDLIKWLDKAGETYTHYYQMFMGGGHSKKESKLVWGHAKDLIKGWLGGLVGAASGEYITGPQVRLVGEDGPEWIVPDTPQGIRQYVPKMLEGPGGSSPTTPRSSNRATGNSSVESLLRETNRLLVQIADVIQEQNDSSELTGDI